MEEAKKLVKLAIGWALEITLIFALLYSLLTGTLTDMLHAFFVLALGIVALYTSAVQSLERAKDVAVISSLLTLGIAPLLFAQISGFEKIFFALAVAWAIATLFSSLVFNIAETSFGRNDIRDPVIYLAQAYRSCMETYSKLFDTLDRLYNMLKEKYGEEEAREIFSQIEIPIP